MIPKSGGDYAYIKHTFGPMPAFLYLWSALLVIMPAGNAIIALTFASYVLQPFYPECDPPVQAVRLIAAAVISLLTAVNCLGSRPATKVTDILSITKVTDNCSASYIIYCYQGVSAGDDHPGRPGAPVPGRH